MTTSDASSDRSTPMRRRFRVTVRGVLTVAVAGIYAALLATAAHVLLSGQDITAYPFQTNLPLGISGLILAVLGVGELAANDLGKTLYLGTHSTGRPSYRMSGFFFVWMGLNIFFQQFPTLLIHPSEVSPTLSLVWLVGFPVTILAIYSIAWIFSQRTPPWQAFVYPTSLSPAGHITRRTFLAGMGVAAVGITSVGWLIRSLPQLVSKYTYRGQHDFVNAVAWSPDGKRIASGDVSGSAQAWDATTGAHAISHSGQSQWITGVSWAPDSRRVASSAWDATVQVWDATTGETLVIFRGHQDSVQAVVWAPQGEMIASSTGDDGVLVWDATSGSIFTKLAAKSSGVTYVNAFVWSPSAHAIAIAEGSGILSIWDVSTGRQIAAYPVLSGVQALAWSSDGKRIAVGSDNRTAQIVDAESGAPLVTYRGHGSGVTSVAWAPDGKYIASASEDQTVQLWDSTSGRQRFSWHGHFAGVKAVAWSPDGAYIASGGWDTTVQVWQPQLG